jgi:hypothetical protein
MQTGDFTLEMIMPDLFVQKNWAEFANYRELEL